MNVDQPRENNPKLCASPLIICEVVRNRAILVTTLCIFPSDLPDDFELVSVVFHTKFLPRLLDEMQYTPGILLRSR